VCTACTYCQMQFEHKQSSEATAGNYQNPIPSILISQLIGLSVGLSEDEIGIRDAHLKKLMA